MVNVYRISIRHCFCVCFFCTFVCLVSEQPHSTQTNFYFYYRDIIYNLYQDMCIYSQLKKNMCNPPPKGHWRPSCPEIVRV